MHGNRPFVGREAELLTLRAALDGAAAGYGSVVAIAGEAGIGKSRLVEEFARRAQGTDALVLRGRCYEDDWAPPYSPFVEAIEAYVREHAGEIAAAERIEVSRIVPGMDAAVSGEEPSRRSEERKYRLYQAVTRMLQDAAASTPVCLVLEDLHDADSGTLELLTHLGRNLQSTRLLLAVTYRNNEVTPDHLLSQTLAEIDRRSPTRRMVMSGLSLEEATELVAVESEVSVSAAVANEAWVRTDGHPLFLRELARDLAGAGAPALPRQLPASLQELIGVRLANLSLHCRQLLQLASVIGHEAPLGTLGQVSPLENGALGDALSEAVTAGVLDERPSTGGAIYVFQHGVFREALYMGLPASERDELHVHVGHALEAALGGNPGHAAELAEHLAHSMDRDDMLKAAGYAELAAKHAASVFSWANAAAWYERALELLDRSNPGDRERRCDLLLALGKMLFNNGELPRLEDDVAEEAFHLAVAIDDSERAATVAMLAIRSMVQRELYPALQTERGGVWVARAVRYATHDDAARLRTRYFAAVNRGRWDDLPEILNEARYVNDPNLFHSVATLAMKGSPGVDTREQAIAREILLRPDEEASADTVAMSSYFAGLASATWGDLDAARNAFERVQRLSRQTPLAGTIVYGLCADAALRILDGDLESAVALWDECPESAGQVMLHYALAMPLRWLGRVDQLLSMPPEPPGPWHGYFAAVSGDVQQARAEFDYLWCEIASRDEIRRRGATDVYYPRNPWDTRGTLGHGVPLFVLEGAMLLNDPETVRMLVDYAQTNWRPMEGWWTFQVSDRCIGDGLAFLGDHTAARQRYESALALAQEMRFRPEIALAHLGLAETLHAGFPRERVAARAHLESCLPEFEAMRMRPALERGQALLAKLEGSTPASPNGLSPREFEVLQLIASGQSSPEIAESLVLSPRTVERHIQNVYNKLGVHNRVEASNWAREHGIVP